MPVPSVIPPLNFVAKSPHCKNARNTYSQVFCHALLHKGCLPDYGFMKPISSFHEVPCIFINEQGNFIDKSYKGKFMKKNNP